MKLSEDILRSVLTGVRYDFKRENLYCDCPWCGHNEAGISLYIDNHPFNCFRKKKCGIQSNVFGVFKKLGREDLLGKLTNPKIELTPSISSLIESEIDLEAPDVKLPIGYKRVFEDNYLIEHRGFRKIDFEYFEVGRTKIDLKRKKYVIFPVYEQGVCKGFVGRFAGEGDKGKRYLNSEAASFGKILYNIDRVNSKTETVILVEGIMDCTNITKLLSLEEQSEVVSCATFGAKLSEVQAIKLKQKGVKNIIFLFDPDVIDIIKKYAYDVKYMFNVKVGTVQRGKDAGEINETELIEILNNLQDVLNFTTSKVNPLL